jgi:hypothetical protein
MLSQVENNSVTVPQANTSAAPTYSPEAIHQALREGVQHQINEMLFLDINYLKESPTIENVNKWLKDTASISEEVQLMYCRKIKLSLNNLNRLRKLEDKILSVQNTNPDKNKLEVVLPLKGSLPRSPCTDLEPKEVLANTLASLDAVHLLKKYSGRRLSCCLKAISMGPNRYRDFRESFKIQSDARGLTDTLEHITVERVLNAEKLIEKITGKNFAAVVSEIIGIAKKPTGKTTWTEEPPAVQPPKPEPTPLPKPDQNHVSKPETKFEMKPDPMEVAPAKPLIKIMSTEKKLAFVDAVKIINLLTRSTIKISCETLQLSPCRFDSSRADLKRINFIPFDELISSPEKSIRIKNALQFINDQTGEEPLVIISNLAQIGLTLLKQKNSKANGHTPSSTEFKPTLAFPGTDEKLEVLAARVRDGHPLFHDNDRDAKPGSPDIDDKYDYMNTARKKSTSRRGLNYNLASEQDT